MVDGRNMRTIRPDHTRESSAYKCHRHHCLPIPANSNTNNNNNNDHGEKHCSSGRTQFDDIYRDVREKILRRGAGGKIFATQN